MAQKVNVGEMGAFLLRDLPRLTLGTHRYWDQYYPGGSYDALARRKSDVSVSRSSLSSVKGAVKKSDSDISKATKKPVRSTVAGGPTLPSAAASAETGQSHKSQLEAEYQKIVQELTSQVSELNGTMDQVSKEREFYFNKLREIEVYVQQCMDASPEPFIAKHLKSVQEILYKTEDGFEIPDAEEAAVY